MALQQQIDGSRSMAANREQNLLVASMPKIETPPTTTKLPPPPKREDFKRAADFEEEMGYGQGHVGAIHALVKRQKRSKDSPEK